MDKTNPIPVSKISQPLMEDVDIALAAKVVAHGGRFYLTIRSADLEFWGIRAKDLVHLKIDKVKRSTPWKDPFMEEEKTEE